MVDETTKTFHKILVSYDEEEKQKRREQAKVFPFSDIWNLFYDNSLVDDDEASSVDKFKEYLNEEVEAIKQAHYPEDNQHEKTYKAPPQNKTSKSKNSKGGKNKSVRKKFSDVAVKFFQEEDNYIKNYEASYKEYLAEEKVAERVEDEVEREIRLKEIKKQYKDAIDAFNKCKEAYIEFEKYEATVSFLDSLPKSVLANIIEFRKICDEKGCPELFSEGFKDLFSYTDLLPEYKDRNGKELMNEHRLSIGKDNNIISHSIKNVNGSNLDLTITNSGMTIARCNENMTDEQVKSLADYSYKFGAEVTDFGTLANTQVVDKDGKEIGVIEEEYKKALAKNREEQNKERETEVECVDDFQIDHSTSYFGPFIPQEKITKKTKTTKLLGRTIWETETPTGLDMQKAHSAIKKFAPTVEIIEECRFGKTVLKVYADSDDIEDDCKYDDKGKVKHNKRFAITFDHNKLKSSIYLGSKEKMTPDLARVVLDTYKEQGYKYFQFPPLNSDTGFGKEGQSAFLEASVKTGMVILLKGKDGKGCDISGNDLNTILEKSNKEQNFIDNPNQKIEYFMRWHEQLEKYCEANPKKAAELSEHVKKFKQQAQFIMFEKSYKGIIESEIRKNVTENGWDEVHLMTAKHTYAQIVKDIYDKGVLGGKRYNPLDIEGNSKLILNEFNRLTNKNYEKYSSMVDQKYAEIKQVDGSSKNISEFDRQKKALAEVEKVVFGNITSIKSVKDQGVNIDLSLQDENGKLTGKRYTIKTPPSTSNNPVITPQFLLSLGGEKDK